MTDQYPINEIFGPTIQGEGPNAGRRTFFVRFAGCDYDCIWCDTKYAVSPKYPGWSKMQFTVEQVVSSLELLGAKPNDTITLSGGNPALFVDEVFVSEMHAQKWLLAMETQGSKLLLRGVSDLLDTLVVSPKPPSSGMSAKVDPDTVRELVTSSTRRMTALKYVIFGQDDLEWVMWLEKQMGMLSGDVLRYLSIGTPLGAGSREQILYDYQRVVDLVLKDRRFSTFTVLPQLHVLLWGQKRGV